MRPHPVCTILEANPGVYSEVSISGRYPGTIAYDYIFAEPIESDAANAYFDSMVPTFQTLCDTQVFPSMRAGGVSVSPKVTYTYYNNDGSQLWSRTFEPS